MKHITDKVKIIHFCFTSSFFPLFCFFLGASQIPAVLDCLCSEIHFTEPWGKVSWKAVMIMIYSSIKDSYKQTPALHWHNSIWCIHTRCKWWKWKNKRLNCDTFTVITSQVKHYFIKMLHFLTLSGSKWNSKSLFQTCIISIQQIFFFFAAHMGLLEVQMQTQDIEEKADKHKNSSSLQKHTLVVDKCSATLSSV